MNTETFEIEEIVKPKSVFEDFVPEFFEYATAWQRFANMIIDCICYYLFAIGTLSILYLTDKETFEGEGMAQLSIILCMFLYFVFFEALIGQTIGKVITRTKVVDHFNNKPSFSRVMGRTLCRLIPFDGLSFFSGGEGWHDSISKTRVIKIQ
ncbi:RDD family protein [Solitalea canadensis]|uniref:Putative membrane protein/domain protein n=1 Tax=Solitalea canadensis (strain ATCC 29591 / DSM 3403 / JCM 21819 / LMG 8368 / NBRC 15130 / NCIMB 12057 / USAM 9D) TaxID=929556 RepID=H8KTW4_SOLCM|nr:RDD family protein [Solitalea canadensis]AFD06814.1 putative membrane protein/domain protein [Solitalea canadensis DSM 3403]